tara:strand:- start:283 stop:588 length:306 start_codon:yes stop_codon:yes gene_type:complete
MHKTLRQKYDLDDRHPAFPRYDRNLNDIDKDKENNKTTCFISTALCSITLLNTFYVGIALYFYNKYIHETFLNDPQEVDTTYNKMKHLINFSCLHIPDINC